MKRLVIALGIATFFFSASLASAGNKKTVVAPKMETIQGTLNIVSDDQKVIFVRSADGVIYDFRISADTKVEQAGHPISASEIASLAGKQVSITFRALKTGNAALRVEFQ